LPESIFGCRHAPGTRGSIDESERRFSPSEKKIAEQLEREGHKVASQKEGPQYGKMADAQVCGQPTEFKRLVGHGTAPPENRVKNKLNKSKGQGSRVIVDTTADPKVTRRTAHTGVQNFLSDEDKSKRSEKLKGDQKAGIRIIGKDFDRSYDQSKLKQMRAESGKVPQRSNAREGQNSMPKRDFTMSQGGVGKSGKNQRHPSK
jgi:hypothetical protein